MNESAEDALLHRRPLLLRDVSLIAGDHVLLKNTSATIPGGEITVIVGGSGAAR